MASLPAFGLGLGEFVVSSAIGQPFRAHVKLMDASEELANNCLQLKEQVGSGMALPSGLKLEIQRAPNKPALLKIFSTQSLFEPALAFTLSAVCEIPISRDYTLLLDPIAETDTPTVESLPVVDTPASTKPKSLADAPSTIPVATQSRLASVKPANARPSGLRPAVRKNRLPGKPKQDRLVLSHGSIVRDPPAGISSPASKAMTLNELADENTALNLKLEHLENQLAALQKRHADLVAQIQVKNQTLEKENTMNTFSYAILAFSLVLILAAAWLFYYRGKRKRVVYIDEDTNIQHLRRASTPVVVSGMEMESLPPSTNEIIYLQPPGAEGNKQPDSDIPENFVGTPEIHDALADEVEVFVAHGQHSLAIRLLEEHIRQHPIDSPAPWLLLLDLLHRSDDAANYEEVRTRCRSNFNIIIPTFENSDTSLPVTAIESYKHVMAELVKLWQTPKADAYLDALLHDNRGGNRVGFDPSAYQDILLLREVRTLRD